MRVVGRRETGILQYQSQTGGKKLSSFLGFRNLNPPLSMPVSSIKPHISPIFGDRLVELEKNLHRWFWSATFPVKTTIHSPIHLAYIFPFTPYPAIILVTLTPMKKLLMAPELRWPSPGPFSNSLLWPHLPSPRIIPLLKFIFNSNFSFCD